MKAYPTFKAAIETTGDYLRDQSYPVHPMRWQSTDVSAKPEMSMREVLNLSFAVQMRSEDLDYFAKDIGPNLPWADDHFEERVGGLPLNPGEQWKNWPWSLSADKFRTEGEQFSHTYMERYWPKHANMTSIENIRISQEPGAVPIVPNRGIRYDYGDLNDVVDQLANDPLTRQAYLPVWFPEDTGVVHGERVPCTLGYHFILRNGFFHHTYYIRSCDFYRHFRDDLYLSVRLHLWVLDQLRKLAVGGWSEWDSVQPGLFTFHCVSMHCFINDYITLWGPHGEAGRSSSR